jgi:hypothetical protein
MALRITVFAAAVACLLQLLSDGALAISDRPAAQASSAAPPGWYRVSLARGEINGYIWGAGAKVPRDQPLGRICLSALTVAPPEPGEEDVEASETSLCGRLTQPSESVSVIVHFAAPEGATSLMATVFRPAVQKVVLELVGGGQEVLRTALRKTKRQRDMGVPRFRYLVHQLDPGVCVKRIATYDHAGALIARENAEPGC